MPDYKEMYLTLFRATEQAINLLIAAQQTCEDMYVNASEDINMHRSHCYNPFVYLRDDILGVSGAGKSFTAKEETTNIILTDPNADVIIIDPEREVRHEVA